MKEDEGKMGIQQGLFRLTAVNLGQDNVEVVLILYSIEMPISIRKYKSRFLHSMGYIIVSYFYSHMNQFRPLD